MPIPLSTFDSKGTTPTHHGGKHGIQHVVLTLLYNGGKPQAYSIVEIANATGQSNITALKRNLYTMRPTKKGNGTITVKMYNGVLHYKLTPEGIKVCATVK